MSDRLLLPVALSLALFGAQAAAPAWVSAPASGRYVLYDDFAWTNTTLDRAKWWRGGVDGVDGTNVILNESDLTSAAMFREGDFAFVVGGHSASAQGLLGLGDIDDGDPFLILSARGDGWRFHVRNGSAIYTGPVVTPALAAGDVVVFHWDAKGSSVAINGAVKDAQTRVHPPAMPLTMLEWTGTATKPDKAGGRIVVDAIGYSATPVSHPRPAATGFATSAGRRVTSATLVEDAYIDSSKPGTNFNGGAQQIRIRNCNHHPDLTGAGNTVDSGRLGLVQFALPQLPAGWSVAGARLAGVVAQHHALYGLPGWAPGRPVELEVAGLDVNPDLSTVSYHALHDATGQGVISNYMAAGSANFTFGRPVQSLEILRFDTAAMPAGSPLQFPDREGRLCAFVRSKIGRAEPRVITLALGPGRTQAVSGMECDFAFHARENTAGLAPMSLTLELEREP